MASGTEMFVRKIENLFGDIYAADEVKVWLDTPQAALGDKRPIDLIEAGQGDAVVQVVNEVLDNTLL